MLFVWKNFNVKELKKNKKSAWSGIWTSYLREMFFFLFRCEVREQSKVKLRTDFTQLYSTAINPARQVILNFLHFKVLKPRRIREFLGLLDPNPDPPLVRGMDPVQDPSITNQKY
jgi:hypothetical protein